jgi:hypothetical protein
LHVTLEEGTCAAWLHGVLKPHVTEVRYRASQFRGRTSTGRIHLQCLPSGLC